MIGVAEVELVVNCSPLKKLKGRGQDRERVLFLHHDIIQALYNNLCRGAVFHPSSYKKENSPHGKREGAD